MVDLLDRLIEERTEYTYWMAQKATDPMSHTDTQRHLYYIQVLKETRTILAERMEPEVTCPTNNDILGKRKPSCSTILHGSDQNKAAKTEATTSKPVHVFKKTTQAVAVEKPQQLEWRRAVADNCNNTTDSRYAAKNKSVSYAGAARAIAA